MSIKRNYPRNASINGSSDNYSVRLRYDKKKRQKLCSTSASPPDFEQKPPIRQKSFEVSIKTFDSYRRKKSEKLGTLAQRFVSAKDINDYVLHISSPYINVLSAQNQCHCGILNSLINELACIATYLKMFIDVLIHQLRTPNVGIN